MREKIQTISLGIIAIVILVSAGWVLAEKYLTLQSQVNQIVSFLNTQIQSSASKGVK